ncbi:MAG: hypothetical protein AAF226_12330, partial [Verrucomicrobiota bacterium]
METDKLSYRLSRSYDEYGRPTIVRLRSLDASAETALKHDVSYTWTPLGQLDTVTSAAGTFAYTYNEANPALLASMTGPAAK